MIAASKILTVSYGTFSCTLEGFDDSFSTMKAIAEYFRDLAADDRYFGAEPPVPDAEMLARIAAGVAHAPVQARIEDQNVVLSARSAPVTSAPPPAPVPAPVTVAEELPALNQPPNQPPNQPTAQIVIEEPPAAMPTSDEGDSIAAKLQRIRAVVSKAKATAAKNVIVPVSVALYEDDYADDLLPETARPGTAEPGTAEPEVAHEPTAQSEISTKLEAPADEALNHADLVDGTAAGAAPVATQNLSEQALSADAPAQTQTQTQTQTAITAPEEYTEDLDTDGSDDAAPSSVPDQVAHDSAADPQKNITADVTDPEDETSPADSDSDSDTGNDTGNDTGTGSDNREARPDVAEPHDILPETGTEGTADPAQTAPDQTVDDARDNTGARVVKLKKSDFNAAVETGELQSLVETTIRVEDTTGVAPRTLSEAAQPAPQLKDTSDDTVLRAVKQSVGETSLSPEDEADLMNELAGVERDAATSHEASPNAGNDTPPLDQDSSIEDTTASRLLNETDEKLKAADGSRRRSAISHLRAAVVATEADRKITGKGPETDESEAQPYHSDLDRVIRPRRPRRGDSPTRMAPLVLVSEQRVDIARTPMVDFSQTQDNPRAPVKPRRISNGNLALKNDLAATFETEEQEALETGNNFAEFAERMDAHDLPDLLEAAAAYIAFVQGQPHFSRPQIIRSVTNLKGDHTFRREDGLRSFGTLLRQGKIVKIRRGAFTIADTSRFNPKAPGARK